MEICHFFYPSAYHFPVPSQGPCSFIILLCQLPWEAVKTFLGDTSVKPGLCELLVIKLLHCLVYKRRMWERSQSIILLCWLLLFPLATMAGKVMINKGEISVLCRFLNPSVHFFFKIFFTFLPEYKHLFKARNGLIHFHPEPSDIGRARMWGKTAYSFSHSSYHTAGSSFDCRWNVLSSGSIWRVREASAPPWGGQSPPRVVLAALAASLPRRCVGSTHLGWHGGSSVMDPAGCRWRQPPEDGLRWRIWTETSLRVLKRA